MGVVCLDRKGVGSGMLGGTTERGKVGGVVGMGRHGALPVGSDGSLVEGRAAAASAHGDGIVVCDPDTTLQSMATIRSWASMARSAISGSHDYSTGLQGLFGGRMLDGSYRLSSQLDAEIGGSTRSRAPTSGRRGSGRRVTRRSPHMALYSLEI